MSVLSPNGKSTATISAGITKKTASDRVPPTVCGGARVVALPVPDDAPDQQALDGEEDRAPPAA